MAKAFVGIGSNVEPARHVAMALALLRKQYPLLVASRVWRSRAVGFDGADFYNLVISFDSALDPQTLQAQLHALEAQCGRRRSRALVSRTVDFDLLLLDDIVYNTPPVTLPRHDILDYAFVLCPLAELAGDYTHPHTGRSIAWHWQHFKTDEPPLVAVDAAQIKA